MNNFVSPHVHVQSLDSASTPAAFAEREIELGTGYLTITDHGSLAGCQPVYALAHKKKLTPILGLEGYFRDDQCPIFLDAGVARNAAGTFADYFKYAHFTSHYLDQDAFKAAIRVLSRAPVEKHGSESKPLFNWTDMEELGATNTTITTGCLIGMVQRHLLQNNDPAMARKYYERLRDIVRPGNFYVEVFPHVCSHNWVSGVFLELETPPLRSIETVRFYEGKNLRTNIGEIRAGELAAAFAKKDCPHTHLLAVKDYHTWVERESPEHILSAKAVEDFVQNECRPWCPDGDVQLGANKFMLELAAEYGDPVLVSDDAHYAHPEEKVVQDVRLAQSGNWRFFGNYARQSSAEALEYFRSKMGISDATFEGWVENSHAWASRFKDFKLITKPSIPTKFYEALYPGAGCKNSLEYTMHLIEQRGRMDWKDPVRVERLRREIKLLYKNGVMDLLPYFMIDEEAVRLYRDHGQLTGPGRGSAAGLSLAYYLGITHVDPIKYGLSLERFMTEDRIRSGKLPDIDQDLPSRDLLVGEDGNSGWLRERFGDHVAQISTVMTLKLRSSVLDVARFTYGSVPPEIAALAHRFEKPPQGLEDYKFVHGYEDGGSWEPGSITFDPALQEYVAKFPDQWKIVQKCLGLGRSQSRHACAFVIANEPVGDFIPLTEIGGVRCTQPTAGAVEALGGLKMDFLVVNSLNDIASAIKMIQERHCPGISPDGAMIDGKWVPTVQLVPYKGGLVDIWDLPPAQEVFADVATGKTETVFQFHTPGAVQWLKHFSYRKPDGNYAIDSVLEMAAFTALDRPGALNARVRTPDTEDGHHNMLVEYARRARGATPSPDVFRVFDQLFPETHGIMVFQEQLQRLYQEITGCTGAEAEAFRGDIAKKLKEKIIAAYPKFMEGASVKLGSTESAQAVWDFINTWAEYGFNMSHAVCYSVLGYACAFLKHHYPLEWWTAVLQHAKKDEISEKFWRYCGKDILLPDVTKANANFAIDGDKIQAPISLLDGVGPAAHAELIAGAPYADIAAFIRSIEDRKKATVTTKTVVEKVQTTGADGAPVEVEIVTQKVVKGRSAIHRGIVYKLLVSGAMSRLFPEGLSTLEQMEAYEQAAFDEEQRQRIAAGKKPSKKKAPKPIQPQFAGLNQYTRYQLRKEILPAYSEFVAPAMLERQHPGVYLDGGRYRYRVDGHGRGLAFATPADLDRVNFAHKLPEGGVRVCVAGYIEDVRVFEYGPKDEKGRRRNPKKAADITIDVGARMKFVRWPDRDTEELSQEGVAAFGGYEKIKGAIAVLTLSKWREGKPFSIEAIEIIQPPFGAAEEPDKEESP